MRSVLNNNALNSCTFDNLKSRYRIFFNPLVMRCLVPTDRFYIFGSRQGRGAKRRGDVFAKRTQFLCSTKPMVESKWESLGIMFSEKMGAPGLRGMSVEHSPGTSAPCGSCNMLTPDAETAVTASQSAAAELDPIGAQPALVVIDKVAAIECGPATVGICRKLRSKWHHNGAADFLVHPGRYSKQDVNVALSGFKSWPGDKRNRNVVV